MNTNHRLSPTGALSAKEGLWKIAAIRPVIVFLGGSYPERLVECGSDQPLPSLELVTHKTHKCRQTGAYRTLNKRGHIPYVFPHEVTSCSRGRVGCWESTGIRLRTTLPLPKVLSALCCCCFFFFSPSSLSSSFNPSLPPTLLPALPVPSHWNCEAWSDALVQYSLYCGDYRGKCRCPNRYFSEWQNENTKWQGMCLTHEIFACVCVF